MSQANDLPSRMDRAENNIIDLRLAASALLQVAEKNTADIAALIEVSRRNSELGRQNSELGRQNSELGRQNSELGRQNSEQINRLQESTIALQASQAQTEEAIRDIRQSTASINASIERMDRLFDYLIRRDQGRSDQAE